MSKKDLERYVENLEQVRISRGLESQQISNLKVVQTPSFVDYPVGASNRVILASGVMGAFAFAWMVGVLCALLEPKSSFVVRPDEYSHQLYLQLC